MDISMIFRPSAPLMIAALRVYRQQQNLFEIVYILWQTSHSFFKQTLQLYYMASPCLVVVPGQKNFPFSTASHP